MVGEKKSSPPLPNGDGAAIERKSVEHEVPQARKVVNSSFLNITKENRKNPTSSSCEGQGEHKELIKCCGRLEFEKDMGG